MILKWCFLNTHSYICDSICAGIRWDVIVVKATKCTVNGLLWLGFTIAHSKILKPFTSKCDQLWGMSQRWESFIEKSNQIFMTDYQMTLLLMIWFRIPGQSTHELRRPFLFVFMSMDALHCPQCLYCTLWLNTEGYISWESLNPLMTIYEQI